MLCDCCVNGLEGEACLSAVEGDGAWNVCSCRMGRSRGERGPFTGLREEVGDGDEIEKRMFFRRSSVARSRASSASSSVSWEETACFLRRLANALIVT